nr:hypothetical protein [Tanacetum cinerariifolium]
MVVDEEPNKKYMFFLEKLLLLSEDQDRLNWPSFYVGEKRADDAPDVSYGLVRFGDETKQISAMTEMNGRLCSTTPMRIRPATNKNAVDRRQYQKGRNITVMLADSQKNKRMPAQQALG